MTKEKQIEEMTEHLVNIQHDFDNYCAKPCRECDLGGVFNCESYYRATELYNAGYRKTADVAREIFAEIDDEIKNHGITYALRKIAELKKKYTEGEKHRCHDCKHCASANESACEACIAGSRWESEDTE